MWLLLAVLRDVARQNSRTVAGSVQQRIAAGGSLADNIDGSRFEDLIISIFDREGGFSSKPDEAFGMVLRG